MEKISILIADDHTLVRQTWGFVVKSDNRFNVVAECANGKMPLNYRDSCSQMLL
jgi:two-component system invasion response regulator UvrY